MLGGRFPVRLSVGNPGVGLAWVGWLGLLFEGQGVRSGLGALPLRKVLFGVGWWLLRVVGLRLLGRRSRVGVGRRTTTPPMSGRCSSRLIPRRRSALMR